MSPISKIRSYLPQLDRAVWILTVGRLLLQFGSGFVLFYAPIYFVNQVGLSATQVGIALGSGQIAGIIGRLLGGTLSDSPRWGRRRTLLSSAAISVLADVAFVATQGMPLLVVGNWLMGLGIGLYWPSMETLVADLTAGQERREAYALARLADSLGLSLGVALGGSIVQATGAYRFLFVIDGLSFVVFGLIIYGTIAETPGLAKSSSLFAGWKEVATNPFLWGFAAVNVAFTMYISQIQSTLPLYLTNVVGNAPGNVGDGMASGQPFSERTISVLFAGHVAFAAIAQLPVSRRLGGYSYARAMQIAAGFFALGFVGIWATGWATMPQIWAAIALSTLTLGMVSYLPAPSAWMADLAPDALRGTYLAILSLCWAVGYAVGPPLGGLALDASPAIARQFWLVLAASTALAALGLQLLHRTSRGLSAHTSQKMSGSEPVRETSSQRSASVVRDAAFGIVPIRCPQPESIDSYLYLLIQHNAGHWAFPKGHAEKGEVPLETARREFEEETGIRDYRALPDPSWTEEYAFKRRGRHVLKTVTYFLAIVQDPKVRLQASEIQASVWKPFEEARSQITYDPNRQVLEEVRSYLGTRPPEWFDETCRGN